MMSPPRLASALLRCLLPRHEISEALEGDLREGYVRRAARSPGRARWWYRRQVVTLPYLALHKQIRRLRARQAPAEPWSGGGWMGGMAMDLRVAVRSLLRRPVFSGVAVATLALSIGAATLLFSVVKGVLLSPLPYEKPDELVTVYLTNDEWRDNENELLRSAWDVYLMTLAHAEAFRDTPGPIVGVTAYTYQRRPLDTGDGSDEPAEIILVDRGTFPVLGVEPSMGRLPTDQEIREGAPVAVLRHDIWTSRFGGDPDVLGRSFGLGERTFTVIGVMPPGFFFPREDGGDLWAPVTVEAREWPNFYGVARLAPGATVAEASEFFERVARRLGEEDPSKAGLGGRAVPHVDSVVGNVRDGLELLFGTALLVVLVACVNLGNLFLARAVGRREELAVRVSLGAGMGSLTATVLAEVLVIGLAGGGLGVALAAISLHPFVQALATALRALPRQDVIGLDPGVMFFSVAATALTIVAAGLVPTLAAARRAPARALGHARRAGSSDAARRTQRLLLGMQGALTIVLVSAAALLARSFLAATSVDMGMETRRVAVFAIHVDEDRYADAGELGELEESIRSRVAALSGVSRAALTTSLPGEGGVLLFPVRPEGAEPDEGASVTTVSASGDYFAAMGIPLLVGRELEPRDASSESSGVVVSESLATQVFGVRDVVGRRLLVGTGDDARTAEIVGVVGETRQLSPFQPPAATLYQPISQTPEGYFYLTLAADGDPNAVLETARALVLGVDPAIEVQQASTLDLMLRRGMRHIRLRMVLMLALATLAGVLALIGISGVVAHFLSEQTRDVGIRMALGAASGKEVGRVVRYALGPTALGLAVGVTVAFAASGLMEDFVFGIEPTDPLTYATVTAGLLGAALLAAWIPARRAAAVDPARVLNREA